MGGCSRTRTHRQQDFRRSAVRKKMIDQLVDRTGPPTKSHVQSMLTLRPPTLPTPSLVRPKQGTKVHPLPSCPPSLNPCINLTCSSCPFLPSLPLLCCSSSTPAQPPALVSPVPFLLCPDTKVLSGGRKNGPKDLIKETPLTLSLTGRRRVRSPLCSAHSSHGLAG